MLSHDTYFVIVKNIEDKVGKLAWVTMRKELLINSLKFLKEKKCPKIRQIGLEYRKISMVQRLFKKFKVSRRKKSHSQTFLLWQHTSISYKTRKTNSDFYNNFCEDERCVTNLKFGLCLKLFERPLYNCKSHAMVNGINMNPLMLWPIV